MCNLNVLPVVLMYISGVFAVFDMQFEIGIAVRNHFKSSCVILLHNNNEELGNLQVLQKYEKLLFRKFVRTSTQVVTKLNGTEGERCKNPLFTIFFANQRMQESLAEVSKNRSISIGKWLMFMESKTNLDNFFQNINVPFNCEFLVAQQANDTIMTISEVYHLSESTPLQQNIVATWNNNEGLIWNSKHLFEHRGDLMGIQLTAAVVTSGREPIITKDNRRKPTVLAGYTGNVWKVIEQAVNASTDIYYSNDGKVGQLYPNGSATGLFQMVIKKDVQIGLETNPINPDYLQYVKFLYPTWRLRLSAFIKKPSLYDSPTDAVLAPFSVSMWLAVVASMVTFIAFLTGTWHMGRKFAGGSTPQQESLSLYETWLYVFGLFCQQGQEVTPRSLSGRVVYLMTLCTALILYESYSAIVISFLTIQKQDLPFTDFRTLIDNGHYKLGIAEHNAVIFEAATNPLLKETYEKMIMNSRNDLPADEPQGFTYLCQKDNYAYITAQFFYRVFRKSITCDLVEIPAVSIATYGSIIVDKSLPYIGLLNKRLHDMTSYGIMKRISEDDSPSIVKDEPETELRAVTLGSVAPILSILILGVIAAIVLFLFEHLFHRLSNRWQSEKFSRKIKVKNSQSVSNILTPSVFHLQFVTHFPEISEGNISKKSHKTLE